MQNPLQPGELTQIGEIITYILTFIGGWIMRIIQSKNPNKVRNEKNR